MLSDDTVWHHVIFNEATGKMTMRLVDKIKHQQGHVGGFDQFVKWVAGLDSTQAKLKSLSPTLFKAVKEAVTNEKTVEVLKKSMTEKQFARLASAVDKVAAKIASATAAKGAKLVVESADGRVVKQVGVALTSRKLLGAIVRRGATPVITLIVAAGAARTAQAQGADLKEILSAASFEGMNEFSGANDYKLAFEVVYVTGSDIVFDTFVKELSGAHVKNFMLNSGDLSNPRNIEDLEKLLGEISPYINKERYYGQ